MGKNIERVVTRLDVQTVPVGIKNMHAISNLIHTRCAR